MVIRRVIRPVDPKAAAPHVPGTDASAGTVSPPIRQRVASRESPGPGPAPATTPPQETEDGRDYEVGYGKPPRHTRFVKGRSGNPRGKEAGRRNEKTLIREILGARLPVRTPQGTRRLNSFEISLMRLREKAAKGDLRAIREVLGYLGKMTVDAEHAGQGERALDAADEAILRYLFNPEGTSAVATEGETGDED